MLLEIVGFVLSSLIAGIFVFAKLTGDVFPIGLKRTLNKLAVSNWVRCLPQILPTYNTRSPKTSKEAGILSQNAEWELEQPRKLLSHQENDSMLIHGIDDKGNCLVVKISRFFNNRTNVVILLGRNGETYTAEMEGISNNQVEFSLGTFKLEVIEPFRTWRIWFNGSMRNHGTKADINLVHVTLNFLWKPLDYAKDAQKDANTSLLANVLTFNGPFGQNLMDIKDIVPKGYYQFGILHGISKVNEDNLEDHSMYLYGYRTRQHMLNSSDKDDTMVEIFAMRDVNGDAFRLIGRNGSWIAGEASYSSMIVYPTLEVDVDASCFETNSLIPKAFEVKDKKSTMRVEIWPKYEAIKVNCSLEILNLKMDINGKEANGIVLRHHSPIIHVPILSDHLSNGSKHNSMMVEKNQNFVPLESDECCNVNLVGGKGASLAKLARMNKPINVFQTARGFCATTNLFKTMIDERILTKVFMKPDVPLGELCQEAIEFVKCNTPVENLRCLINLHMKENFDESRSANMRFAVRSSGVLEDGSDLSCAGQNETFLGVDESSIPEKIIQCWTSLFTFQSVSYRLNHGQPAVTEMGVVIQEMVNAASAGVIFTADPRSGNPFEMLITANYGLGESVVTATCDPDSIVVRRERSVNSQKDCETKHLSIGSTTIGEKKTKVILNLDGQSVVQKNLSEHDSSRICLSESAIFQLALIGSKIEKTLGQMKPVDIEWAITENGDLFVLQCRSMTSLDAWIDFEIMHQFDAAIRTRIERLTRANVGEVMPKPIYPIGIQSMSRHLDLGVQKRTMGETLICTVAPRACPMYCNRIFISVYPTLYNKVDAEINSAVSCVDLSVFGRPVITEEIHKVALERHGAASGLSKLSALIDAIKTIRNATKQTEIATTKYDDWTFKLKKNVIATSRSIYEQITEDLMTAHDASSRHCVTSEASSITLVFAFLAISDGKNAEDWSPSLYEDVGRLLSAYTSTESAEMPADMDKLATAILKFGDDFLHVKSSTESISWLKSNESLAEALEKFFVKHGHRSIAELDIGQDSWRTNPTPLIALLKNIVRNKIKNPSKIASPSADLVQNDSDLLKALKTPLKAGTKMFLKFVLPYCRQMVIHRERTKSLMVKVLEQLKLAYHMLAESMVREQLIPDKILIKHLTHHEMGLLIDRHHSCSSILYRALRRMRLYPTLEDLDFPEICIGIPEPVNNSKPLETCDVIKGTPVSAGRIQGTAKVCLSVEEASNQIEEGDILITKGTDIGWSPFFPMLGGVVTELGGLISHGAVVAREYGLPCIVGAANATKIFRSGDEIILDTGTGTISKVKAQLSGNRL